MEFAAVRRKAVTTHKRLYRSTNERMLAGVCGGIAEYLEVDPTLVRLAFVALMFLGGPGLIIYIVLMIVVPEAPREVRKSKNDVFYEDVVRSEIPTPAAQDEYETDESP